MPPERFDLPEDPVVHFGGPDLPERTLRDLLRHRVDLVPAGGEIAWATYYFRDRDLARSLIKASDRGVNVKLRLEARPRRKTANDPVIAMLVEHGLNGGLALHHPSKSVLRGHLHSKIYFFSHPSPTVLVGSFNPSGDDPEDLDVIAEIGDQDRGHNLLVELRDTDIALRFRDHVTRMLCPFARLRHTRPAVAGQVTAWYYPRFLPTVAEKEMALASTIQGCVSHLKDGVLVKALSTAARNGAQVRLIVHDTERRVPEAVVTALADSGVTIRRYRHEKGLPMHAKFLLADEAAWFGSFNYNPKSRWLNHEILLRSEHATILRAFRMRFAEIEAAAAT